MGQLSTPPVILVLVKILSTSADQAWSPIVGGRALFPPLVSTPSLLVHSGPLYHSDQEHYHNNRRVSSYRDPYYRRNYRRRKRYWRHAHPRYRRVRSHSYFSAAPSSPVTDWWSWSEPETRARSRDWSGETETAETGRSLVKSVRSLFGAPEHCLEGGRQFSCTLAPVCWMTGGVATSGITVHHHRLFVSVWLGCRMTWQL